MQKLLADLEQQRMRATKPKRRPKNARLLWKPPCKRPASFEAIDPLAYNEEETRKYLIDQMLADEGWDVGKGMTNTAQVLKEAPVKYQVGASGSGKADYILDDDNGKPLGVVEAKKTAVDPQIGRKQAEQYADGLEREHAQRPVIFYTNGYDLWIWNDKAGEPPRKIYGFYSKDSLQHIHYQRTAKKLDGLRHSRRQSLGQDDHFCSQH
ncbi:MAG: type I restriction endonuclease [Pirellulaceae bacterium]